MRRLAIIGGTGFGDALTAGVSETIKTPYGAASVKRCPIENGELISLARHGAGHTIPPHRINHRANIAALKELAADAVFATAAVGSLRTDLAPGDFVVLDDLIDFMRGDVVTFFDSAGDVRHTDMGAPYDPRLRKLLITTAPEAAQHSVHHSGTYVSLSGPRYETRAEIRLLAQWGGSVVGMTGAPEAILCREIGLPYAAVAVVTNYGCGLVSDAVLSHGDVGVKMQQSLTELRPWLLRAIEVASDEDFH